MKQTVIAPGEGAVDPIARIALPQGVELEHLQRTIGTVVHGVDLRQEIKPEVAQFLRALWLERKVIFFRDQDITIEQHIALGRCFGRLDKFLGGNAKSRVEGYPELLVLKRGADGAESENFFHSDVSYTNPPSYGAVAMVRKGPEIGGDTLFADMTAAYENMSDWLKRAVQGLRAEHRVDELVAYNRNMRGERLARMMAQYPPMDHPLVQTHPETGKKVLYVSLAYVYRILDIPKSESQALVKLLSDQAMIPENQCRWTWKKNSIAIWDNRSTQHYACFDYLGQPRELHRVTIMGDHRWPDGV
jgi:taurine dioxygenase